MLRAVLFDLMGTVLYDPFREALQAATGLTLEELWTLKDPEAWPALELGLIDDEAFAARFWAEPGGSHVFDLAAFTEARRRGYRWLPGMRRLLADLHGQVERHVASNYPLWIEELRQRFGFDGCFEGVWASCHLGARKPDPVFFERLLDEVGLAPGECLFVDDRAGNCAAAAGLGIRTHHFRDAGGLRARLRAEGVTVSVPPVSRR